MKRDQQPERGDGDRISLAPLDPVEALKGLLAVDPDSQPEPDQEPRKRQEQPKPKPKK